MYKAVSVEKRPNNGLYRVSTGADSGYGDTLDDFEELEDALELADRKGMDVYHGPTVEEELNNESK